MYPLFFRHLMTAGLIFAFWSLLLFPAPVIMRKGPSPFSPKLMSGSSSVIMSRASSTVQPCKSIREPIFFFWEHETYNFEEKIVTNKNQQNHLSYINVLYSMHATEEVFCYEFPPLSEVRNSHNIEYTIHETVLTRSKTYKYLGLHLSDDFKWITHISRITKIQSQYTPCGRKVSRKKLFFRTFSKKLKFWILPSYA